MKPGKVFFHPIEGSGQLSISWSAEPKGDAIEAKNGLGVGFFSQEGDLLSVIFDEVKSSEDHQFLEFSKHRIDVTVKKGKVAYKIHNKTSTKSRPKRSTSATRLRTRSKRKSSIKARKAKAVR